MSSPLKVFICYAHEDERILNRLRKQLKPLELQGLVEMWHDREIGAGEKWEQEIDQHLNASQIILLLISSDFIASDYCYGVEMKRAVELHEHGASLVIPVIVRPVLWGETPFARFQALPTDAIPVSDSRWNTEDDALFNVAEGVKKQVDKIIKKPAEISNAETSKSKNATKGGSDPRIIESAVQIAAYAVKDLLEVVREANLDVKTYLPQASFLTDNDVCVECLFDDISHMIRDGLISGIHWMIGEDRPLTYGGPSSVYVVKYSFDITKSNVDRADQARTLGGLVAPPPSTWRSVYFACQLEWKLSKKDLLYKVHRPSYIFDWLVNSENTCTATFNRLEFLAQIKVLDLFLYRRGSLVVNGVTAVREEFASPSLL